MNEDILTPSQIEFNQPATHLREGLEAKHTHKIAVGLNNAARL